jgi:hypothetical protein
MRDVRFPNFFERNCETKDGFGSLFDFRFSWNSRRSESVDTNLVIRSTTRIDRDCLQCFPSRLSCVYGGDVILGVSAMDSSGVAQLITSSLSAGSHMMRAVYSVNGTSYQSTPQLYVVSALPGSGFSPPINLAADSGPTGVTSADFNGEWTSRSCHCQLRQQFR